VGGESLDVAYREVQLATILLRHRRDGQPLLAVLTQGRDEAFLAEPVKRTAHGRPTHAEPLGDDAFGERRTGRELTPDDQLAELLKRVVRVVGLDLARRRAPASARRGLFPRFGGGGRWHEAKLTEGKTGTQAVRLGPLRRLLRRPEGANKVSRLVHHRGIPKKPPAGAVPFPCHPPA
jgi:hypothetical protein